MMHDSNSKNINYPSQLAIFFGLTGAGLIVGSLLTALIWHGITGQSVFTMEKDMQNAKYYNAIMCIQIVSTFLLFVVPAFFFAMICYWKADKFLGFNLHFNFKQVLLVAAILIITIPLSALLEEINKAFPIPLSWATKFKAAEAARELEESALININSFSKYLISMFVIAFCPAVFEELFFRSAMQNLLTKWFKGPWIAIILTGIIFSLVHVSYYGFLVRAVLGFILGLIFYYGKSVWLNMLFHFLVNGLQVTGLYIMNAPQVKHVNDLEDNFPIWQGILALLLLIYVFDIFKKISKKQLAKYPHDELPENDFKQWTVN